jgi:hypothetical protein
MSTEHLVATLRALRRYELVQAQLLEDARLARRSRDEEIAMIRDRLINRTAEPVKQDSLIQAIVDRMNPLKPCGFADAHFRFAFALGMLPVSIMLAIGIATVLERVMS